MSQNRCLCHRTITREFAIENNNLCYTCGNVLIINENSLDENIENNGQILPNLYENSDLNSTENQNLINCNCEFPSPDIARKSCNICGRLLENDREFDPEIYQNERKYRNFFIKTDNEIPSLGKVERKKANRHLVFDDIVENDIYTQIPANYPYVNREE